MAETIETLTAKLAALAKNVDMMHKSDVDSDTRNEKIQDALVSDMKDVKYKVDLLMKERSKHK